MAVGILSFHILVYVVLRRRPTRRRKFGWKSGLSGPGFPSKFPGVVSCKGFSGLVFFVGQRSFSGWVVTRPVFFYHTPLLAVLIQEALSPPIFFFFESGQWKARRTFILSATEERTKMDDALGCIAAPGTDNCGAPSLLYAGDVAAVG